VLLACAGRPTDLASIRAPRCHTCDLLLIKISYDTCISPGISTYVCVNTAGRNLATSFDVVISHRRQASPAHRHPWQPSSSTPPQSAVDFCGSAWRPHPRTSIGHDAPLGSIICKANRKGVIITCCLTAYREAHGELLELQDHAS